MTFKRKSRHFINTKILPYIIYIWVSLIYLTNKKSFKLPANIPDTPFIIASWHGELLLTPYIYKKLRNRDNLVNLISDHRDGEMISKVMSFFGIEAVRGSSRQNPAKALIGAIKKAKAGYDLGITPDGPKGPIFSVANGIIAVSQRQNIPIIALNVVPSKYQLAKSWDRFIIPKLFGTIEFIASEPFYLTDLSKEEAQKVVKEKLLENSILQ
jgi:lysophospholipid acyltransferase (LPLAT)-like uncharacterized protein